MLSLVLLDKQSWFLIRFGLFWDLQGVESIFPSYRRIEEWFL